MADHVLRIGELATKTGTSTDSIRHYERLGLLASPARSRSGYRLFPPEAIKRVQLIRCAVALGFSLRQLASFFNDRRSGRPPCHQVRDTAARILADVEERIGRLEESRALLAALIRDWDERLAQTPPNQPAHLLDGLDLKISDRSRRAEVFRATGRHRA